MQEPSGHVRLSEVSSRPRVLLHWLFENLSSIPEDQWSEVIIAYDNMCQLESLQIAKNPLPLPSPFDKMWMAVRKVCHMLSDNDI